MHQILAIGEVMIELAPSAAPSDAQHLRMSYAGDTFNTSVYLARHQIDVAYFSRLGDDPYSEQIIATLHSESIGDEYIEKVTGRTPGLYLIRNEPNGERDFHFWRSQSPAREMLSNEASLNLLGAALKQTKEVYFSGITLAILSPDARGALLQRLSEFRANGGAIIFDNNYRASLWPNQTQAQQAMNDALTICDTALLTDDDALRLWGDDSTDALVDRCLRAGVSEVVIKRGAQPVVMAWAPEQSSYRHLVTVAVPKIEQVIDTTAAGDIFNAGFLAARLNNAMPKEAIRCGISCAAQVIQFRGAIIPKSEFNAN